MLTVESGDFPHAEGLQTTAILNGSHIMGRYGTTLYTYSWHVADGTSAGAPGLAAVLAGLYRNKYIAGSYFSGGADYAEMYETIDGSSIEPGYFIALDGDRIRTAAAGDDITGISSAVPTMVGNAAELRWGESM
ncbi:peptidase G2 autoproteolytic cleavage domain-containing protein [Paenibacillus sp. D51F]